MLQGGIDTYSPCALYVIQIFHIRFFIWITIRINESQELHDIKVLTQLRFSLEVLVSVEYDIFVRRMEKLGLTQKNSRFYWPHYIHDMKKNPLGVSGKTHSDTMSKILADMLNTEQKIKFYKKITEISYQLRAEAFKQFKK